VLAEDAARAIGALDDVTDLRRLLYAKSVALWLLVSPACVVVTVGIGAATGRWTTCALTVFCVLVIPAGTLGFSSWLGILYPYHPRPLRWRLEHRHAFRRVVLRWATLVLTPYVLVPAIGTVLLVPAVLPWIALAGPSADRCIPDDQFAVLAALTGLVAAIAFVVGHRLAARLALRRRPVLLAYLADPERG